MSDNEVVYPFFLQLPSKFYCVSNRDQDRHSCFTFDMYYWTGKSGCCSVAKLCPTLATLWTSACRVSLSFPSSQSLHKLIAIELVMPSNHLILCHPLLLASVFPSIRVFSSESALCTRWPKYWSFSNNPSNQYSGLISFTIDWFDLLSYSQDSSPAPQFESIS